ncbi:hypothetical protein Y032_0232g3023 [Ancylostoma ceylanicum]|uniref:BED-type domain-containing protein n=1 Tax=Ancylostoma ceylanicum TaxID=53326 RepID=A0A016SF81_9BILA|nr:hypothetical protein Y032_0232g3023 [Ancylostoma ceylanicum]
MSAVWNYFRKTNDEFGNFIGICTLCNRSLKIPKSKTTTNLLAHLRTSHGEELGSFTRRRFEAGNSGTTSPDDPRMTVHRTLARLIIEGALPLETTTLKPFRDFCATVNPSYHPPSLRMLRTILDEEGCRVEMANRAMLADLSSTIALTVDFYNAFKPNTGLLLIGAQMLSRASLERRTLILDCVPLDLQSFSAYAVSDAIVNCLRRHDVDVVRVGTMVANETQPLQEAALYIRTKFVPCAANSISLVVADTLSAEPFSGVLEKVRRLVSDFQRNRNAKMQLKSRLREFKLPEIVPSADTPNRWITTYNMICDVLMTLPAMSEILRKLNLPLLEPDDLQFLEAFRSFLEPFYSLTKQVCARDATASVYLAVGRILITTTEKRLFQLTGEIHRFGQNLLENTLKYFNPWLGDEFLQMAAFLDPRFAYLETVQPMKSWTATMERFVAHHNTMNPRREPEAPGSSGDSWPPQPQMQSTSVWEILRENQEGANFRSASTWNPGDELRAELQHYGGILRTSRPAFNTDPIHWWRAYMNEFPILANEAFSHLTTPATSVDCQQLLSLVAEPAASGDPSNKIRKTDRLLLMLKAHLHKDVGRECKAWSNAELHRYGYCESAGDDFDDYDAEEDPAWTTFRSDEEKTIADVVEPLLSFVEEDDFDNMKNRQ